MLKFAVFLNMFQMLELRIRDLLLERKYSQIIKSMHVKRMPSMPNIATRCHYRTGFWQ
ncbi:hypothetical protein DNTS_023480 [Danionella cerebrum]|uniref:Uncharacterized protein n=1 Tax=Danionella cerebrum TaxID=2873325 RepID=A0A553MWJ8_9TELE|nr:hypothetical protein DNTS_023480 [Danionella translucida]